MLCIACLFLTGTVTAQVWQDTLDEVKVRTRKKEFISSDEKLTLYSPGQKSVQIDSLQLQLFRRQSVAQLLYQQAPVFIKSYGFNGLATLNFRGSSSAQSQVLWNGVPLQNAALGMADVSLLPVAALDRINVVYGGSAALWGSGSVGGVLLLENDPPVYDSSGKYSLQVSGGAGSFGQYQSGIKMGYSMRKWYVGLNAFGQQAVNNFPYLNRQGEERQMDHSRLAGGGVMLHAGYRPDAKNEFRISAWGQRYRREIPPALFEARSVKEQEDQSNRIMALWEHTARKTVWYMKSAYVQDLMAYDDPAVLMHTRNRSGQYFQEAGMRRKLPANGNLTLFVPVQSQWMERTDGSIRRQTRVALAGALQKTMLRERLSAAVSFRGERIDRTGIFLPGLNLSFTPVYWLELKGNVQRTYRAPTLNEWYFQPGGNEDLRPEHGWAEDLGYVLRIKHTSSFTLTHEAAVFNRDIKDWILWFGGAIWTPHNIAEVRSRGVEVSGKATLQTGRVRWHANSNASLIRAITRASDVPGDGSVGMQIPYTPLWQWQANAGGMIRSFYFNYNHTYSGYRFVTTDESQVLPAFHTGNIQVMYTRMLRASSIQFVLQCNNVFDRRYEVVAGRPMPGRNWLGGISFSL